MASAMEIFDAPSEQLTKRWLGGDVPESEYRVGVVDCAKRFPQALKFLQANAPLKPIPFLNCGGVVRTATAFKRVGSDNRVLLWEVNDDDLKLPESVRLLENEYVRLPKCWAPSIKAWNEYRERHSWPMRPPNKSIISVDAFEPPSYALKPADEVVDTGGRSIAIVTDAQTCGSHDDVNNHAVFRLIADVASTQRLRRGRKRKRSDQYLCTGFEALLKHEPCRACCAALLHARISKVWFFSKNSVDGGLTRSNERTHSLSKTNHRYRAFYVQPSS